MDITLNWKGRMSFEGAGDSGFIQKMDSDESAGGENSAARPVEFIALGMAGCTAMDVISILQKKKQPVMDFQVKVYADRAGEHPKVFTDFELEYVVRGVDIDPLAVERAILLSVENYCSVHAMLEKSAHIRTRFTIIQEQETYTG